MSELETIEALVKRGHTAQAIMRLAVNIEAIKARLEPKKPELTTCPTCGLTDDQIYQTRSCRLAHEMACLAKVAGNTIESDAIKPERRKGDRRKDGATKQ